MFYNPKHGRRLVNLMNPGFTGKVRRPFLTAFAIHARLAHTEIHEDGDSENTAVFYRGNEDSFTVILRELNWGQTAVIL